MTLLVSYQEVVSPERGLWRRRAEPRGGRATAEAASVASDVREPGGGSRAGAGARPQETHRRRRRYRPQGEQSEKSVDVKLIC